MRIAIDASAANDADCHQWLDRILAKIEDRWHVWDLTDDQEVEAIRTSTWCLDPGRQGVRVNDMLVAATKLGAWTLEPHERRLRVTSHPNAHDELAAETACRLAETPLEILVENRDSDGPFLRRIIEELDPDLDVLRKNPTEPIRFDSVGGRGQMAQEVRNRTGGPLPLRLVAVIDSDRKGSNDQESREARGLRCACKQGGLSCWVLAKREAENYLTRGLLAALPNTSADHRQRVAAWDRLSEDQKDFFDMKKGWSKNPSTSEQDLFGGLPDCNRAVLENGFGSNVHECWNVQAVAAAGELRARGQGDLEHGIELIRSEV